MVSALQYFQFILQALTSQNMQKLNELPSHNHQLNSDHVLRGSTIIKLPNRAFHNLGNKTHKIKERSKVSVCHLLSFKKTVEGNQDIISFIVQLYE